MNTRGRKNLTHIDCSWCVITEKCKTTLIICKSSFWGTTSQDFACKASFKGMRKESHRVSTQFIVITSFLSFCGVLASPLTNPLRADGDISNVIPDYFDRKSFKAYHNSTPHDLRDIPIISYNSPDPDCNVGFKLAWSSTVGSPVYASPIIFPSGTVIIQSKLLILVNFYASLKNHIYCSSCQVLTVKNKFY